MSFSMAGGGPRGPQMNVTPLIDVLLVLIIIFMVVVVEERPTGLKAEIPQPAPPTGVNVPPPDKAIVIQVKRTKAADGHPEIKINNEAVPWDRLRERLRDIFAIRVERIAYVEADDDTEFQDVADVIAIAKLAGVDRIGLLTEDGNHAAVTA